MVICCKIKNKLFPDEKEILYYENKDKKQKENRFVSAVVVSAGNSTRMGGINKQFLEINGKPIIIYTLEKFENKLDGIFVTLAPIITLIPLPFIPEPLKV